VLEWNRRPREIFLSWASAKMISSTALPCIVTSITCLICATLSLPISRLIRSAHSRVSLAQSGLEPRSRITLAVCSAGQVCGKDMVEMLTKTSLSSDLNAISGLTSWEKSKNSAVCRWQEFCKDRLKAVAQRHTVEPPATPLHQRFGNRVTYAQLRLLARRHSIFWKSD